MESSKGLAMEGSSNVREKKSAKHRGPDRSGVLHLGSHLGRILTLD